MGLGDQSRKDIVEYRIERAYIALLCETGSCITRDGKTYPSTFHNAPNGRLQRPLRADRGRCRSFY